MGYFANMERGWLCRNSLSESIMVTISLFEKKLCLIF